eukprot:GHRR01008744.1.p2 GENE.GHRR01008744.1~~GHRR01008744.1.p2  ORF type:complete len:115 (+),score=17.69 GHRR01008744.1:2430-2774(+)
MATEHAKHCDYGPCANSDGAKAPGIKVCIPNNFDKQKHMVHSPEHAMKLPCPADTVMITRHAVPWLINGLSFDTHVGPMRAYASHHLACHTTDTRQLMACIPFETKLKVCTVCC